MAFLSLARILGECSTIHSSPALSFFFSSRMPIPLFMPGSVHSGSASRDDCGRMFPDKLCMSSFLDRSPHCLIVSPFRLLWVKRVCVLRCKLQPAILAEWPGSFTNHCGNTGVERTPSKSQHTKLTLEKKILLPLLPGFELATFRSRVRRSTSKLSRFPVSLIIVLQRAIS